MSSKKQEKPQQQKKQQNSKEANKQAQKKQNNQNNNDDVKREQKLQAVILADSFTSTFRPVSIHTPKVLIPLVNVPMIEYTLEFLAQNGVEEVSLIFFLFFTFSFSIFSISLCFSPFLILYV